LVDGESITLDGETGGVVLLSVMFPVFIYLCEVAPSNVIICGVRTVPKSDDSDPLGDGGNELPFELETPFRDWVGDVVEE
jgi:hypothetical protein